ncbi:MAG: hypothetical protein LBE16_01100 [Clostridiales Family XIII bacterium]|jgi:hypothetical protein|nr:hypothetical protein [Clostridiales Family XIII bacterium]
MYYKEREPRKFDYDDRPPRGFSKKAIHMIILLLFLIAAFLFFFPNADEADRQSDAAPDAEKTVLSSMDAVPAEAAAGFRAGAR